MHDEISVRTLARQTPSRHRPRAAALLLAGFALICNSASASGWQWLDGSGRKVFSDMPPPASVPEKSILQRPQAASFGTLVPAAPAGQPPAPAAAATASKPGNGSANAPATNKERNAAPNLSDAELRAAVEKRNNEIRQQNCRRAREDLAALTSGTRLLTLNDRGEPVVLDEARQAAELRRLQRAEQENCQPQNGGQERSAQ